MEVDYKSINKAFSKQSSNYDKEDNSNLILKWMRSMVRNHVLSYLKPGDHILELNAGTGLDASYFAQAGFQVHATDLSDGMVRKIENKIQQNVGAKFTCEQCSYTDLQNITGGPFDFIFSNFGGLNCVSDLQEVTKHFPKLLRPGGYITFVIMPPVCPWEIGLVFKGDFKKAFRRINKNGVIAHLEGEYFKTYYFTPSDIENAFGKNYRRVSLQGLASLSPPPHKFNFPLKFPNVYKALTKIDEKLSFTYPFNRWGDHFIITLQYIPTIPISK